MDFVAGGLLDVGASLAKDYYKGREHEVGTFSRYLLKRDVDAWSNLSRSAALGLVACAGLEVMGMKGASKVAKVGTKQLLKSAEKQSLESINTAVSRKITSQSTKISATSQNIDLDALSRAGEALDRGGLTKAGRALEKHGGRKGSVFPKATGNIKEKNLQGQYHLENILTHPETFIRFGNTKNFGSTIEVLNEKMGGIRFTQQKNMVGFLEPPF